MLAITDKGNLGHVRSALEGITGIKEEPVVEQKRHHIVIVRSNHELNAVDSFRRHGEPAFWPSFEELVVTRQQRDGHPIRRVRRIGIVSGYVFTPIRPNVDFTDFLKQIVGAIDIVRSFSGNPLLLEEDDIQTLKRIEVGRNTPTEQRDGAVVHTFKVGERVRFIDDVRHRWPPGRITKIARQGRIVVDVSMMGRKVEVKSLPHQIVRV